MKIAIVAPLVTAIKEPQRGGSQAFVSDLAQGLAGRGNEVYVYAASGSDVPGVSVIDTGIDPESLAKTLYRASAPATPNLAPAEAAFASVYAGVRRARYDLVHNHAFDVPAIALATELGAPVVHTLHLPPDRAIAKALREAGRDARPPAVAAVSASQARAWRQIVPVDAVLRPLVPTALISWSRPAGEGAVFAGRLSPEKGAVEAIDIARAARVPIDVYGDTYDSDYAREHIDPRGALAGVVVHQGVPRASLWAAMARAALVLYPVCWDEPFGMAAAEAQACGTPVVAFKRGALSEVVTDGLTGFLVPPGDTQAAVEAVGKTADISRRACRDHAEAHLDLEQSLDAHELLYQRVAALNSGVRARD
jgi:glycosyltransferase involved in cell wall biosynthesis